jgi:hypothetical protein
MPSVDAISLGAIQIGELRTAFSVDYGVIILTGITL